MSLIYSEQVGGRRHGLYLGGKTDAKSREKLERWGVTHVLNVTPPKEGSIQAGVPNYHEKHFCYKRVSVYDAGTSNLLQHANEIVAFISSGLCHGSVLVHCQRGVSRSTTCVAFYLMRKAGMTLQDSMALIQQKRPQANPIPAFYSQLQEYEKTCMDLGIFKSRSKPETKRLAPIGPSVMPQKQRIIGPAAMPASTDEKDDNQILCGPELPSEDVAASGSTTTDEDQRTNDKRRGVRSQLVVDKQKEGGTPIIGPHLPS